MSNMNRKEITKMLSDLLIRQRFSGIGKYWAREVCIDFGTTDVKRIDFMQFVPPRQTAISDIEKGIFVCYEIKSCKADFSSGYGRNFIGEKNYFVMPMETYKELIHDIPRGVGVLVPVPDSADAYEEFQHPTDLSENRKWRLHTIRNAYTQGRKRSTTELLFCMLRSSTS